MDLIATAGPLVSQKSVDNAKADAWITDVLYANFVTNVEDTSLVDGWTNQQKLDKYMDLLVMQSADWARMWRRKVGRRAADLAVEEPLDDVT